MQNWRCYEALAAELFFDLGFNAKLNANIEGARGIHNIDVWVTGTVEGLNVKWAVECKRWTSRVPKEKVLAFQNVVQDVGADAGYLLSEIGFQSGAIRAARQTNLRLTSLAEVLVGTNKFIGQGSVVVLHWRLLKVDGRLSVLHRRQKTCPFSNTPAFRHKRKLAWLEFALEEAARGEFPTIYGQGPNDTRLVAHNLEELINIADRLISNAEKYVARESDGKPSSLGNRMYSSASESRILFTHADRACP